MSRVEVHKFGGTSVGTATRMKQDAVLIGHAAKNSGVVVVSSAMSGVTDLLIGAGDAAVRGDRREALQCVASLIHKHEESLAELAPNGGERAEGVRKDLARIGDELRELVAATALLGELTARPRDRIIACGEKLSIRLLALALADEGLDPITLDADTFLETDDQFGEANPLGVVADRTIAAAVHPHLKAGKVPVVTGFCGIAPDGATTTLGRGGSDYTATLIANAIDADEVTIWTDVDGVFSADPRVVPDARCVDQLNYREAAELSFYGAKVLHQRTMIPVAQKGIPVRTRNSFNPDAPGTLVDKHYTPGSHPVKAISAVKDQALVSIEGKGMAGVPGVAARVFSCLADKRISYQGEEVALPSFITLDQIMPALPAPAPLPAPQPASGVSQGALPQTFRQGSRPKVFRILFAFFGSGLGALPPPRNSFLRRSFGCCRKLVVCE